MPSFDSFFRFFGFNTGYNNNGFVKEARQTAQTYVGKTQKEREEENNRVGAIQGLVATTVAAAWRNVANLLEQAAFKKQLLTLTDLQNAGLKKDTLDAVGATAANQAPLSFSDVMQKLLAELQARLAIVEALMIRIEKPLKRLDDYQKRFTQFIENTSTTYKQLAGKLVNILEPDFANLGGRRIFSNTDLQFILGANTHPDFPDSLDRAPTDEESQIEIALRERFPYTPEMTELFDEQQYTQSMQNLSRVLVAKKYTPEDLKPSNTSERSTTLRSQISMAMRPTPSTTARPVQEELKAHQAETQVKQQQFAKEHAAITEEVKATQPLFEELQQQTQEIYGTHGLLDNLNSIVAMLANRKLDPAALDLLRNYQNDFNNAMRVANRREGPEAMGLPLAMLGGATSTPFANNPKPENMTKSQKETAERQAAQEQQINPLKQPAVNSLRSGN